MILATYLMTSTSLLYNFPHTFQSKIVIAAMIVPSEAAIAAATLTARRARFALLAPSSFDTLVLEVRYNTVF